VNRALQPLFLVANREVAVQAVKQFKSGLTCHEARQVQWSHAVLIPSDLKRLAFQQLPVPLGHIEIHMRSALLIGESKNYFLTAETAETGKNKARPPPPFAHNRESELVFDKL
jgi:hypothetical protein